MNAHDRAKARWKGAPRGCQHRQKGLECSRDDKHPGRHHDPRYGWWGAEFRDLDGKPEPRTQFCDLDWQDRFAANTDAPAFYADYNVTADKLFTVGAVGGVYMTKKQVPAFVDNLRKWADMVESYMKTYEE